MDKSIALWMGSLLMKISLLYMEKRKLILLFVSDFHDVVNMVYLQFHTFWKRFTSVLNASKDRIFKIHEIVWVISAFV